MVLLKQVIGVLWSYFTNRKKSWMFSKGCLVIAGGLLTGPLWLPFLAVFIESNTGKVIDEPSPLLALPVLLIGGLAAVVPELLEQRAKLEGGLREATYRKKHDREYATRIKELLPEIAFNDFLHMFGDNHIMKEQHRGTLNDLRHELESNETGFVDQYMETCAGEYLSKINETLLFSATNFFSPRDHRIMNEFWMFPEGNWDRGQPTSDQEALYGRLTRELNELLDGLIAARSNFLREARSRHLLIDQL